MEQFQLSMTLHKVEAGTGKRLQADIINDTRVHNRVEGNDGYSIRLRPSDGSKAIDLSEFAGITLLSLAGEYAESDSASGIVEGMSAPIEFELNGDGTGAYTKASRTTFEGPTSITALHVRAPSDTNDRLIRIKVIVGAAN